MLTSLFVAFEENPWSSRLPVSIASTGEGHGNSQGIFELHIFHQLKEFFEFAIDFINESLVLLVQVLALIGWHFSVKGGSEIFEAPVGEVTKVLEELIVILGDEIAPEKDCVLLFWTVGKQIIPPNLRSNS